jgi:hypothetical protein
MQKKTEYHEFLHKDIMFMHGNSNSRLQNHTQQIYHI